MSDEPEVKPELWTASPTALEDFDTCERYGEFRHKLQLQSATTEGVDARVMGQLVHAGFAKLWETKSLEAATAEVMAQNAPPLVLGILGRYNALYRNRIEQATVLGVEVKLPHPNLRYKGKLDLVLEAPEGFIDVVDHKTTSKDIAGSWAEQWQVSEQLGGYADLAERHFSRPVRFIVVDAIQIPRGQLMAKHFNWQEVECKVPIVQELVRSQAAKTRRAVAILEGEVEAQPNSKSCFRFNRLCEFLPVCRLEPELRAAKVLQMVESGELQRRERGGTDGGRR